jgi:hypothetical protein
MSQEHRNAKTIDALAILTEYEAGHVITAVEWIARAGKPIMEIGGRIVHERDMEALAHDLNHCLTLAGEQDVRGFIMRERENWWLFGVYRYPWALAAFLYLQSEAPRLHGIHAHWIRGLLFGYDAEAIQRFIVSASDEPGPMLGCDPYKYVRALGRVEIYDFVVSPAQLHNNLNGRYQTPC